MPGFWFTDLSRRGKRYANDVAQRDVYWDKHLSEAEKALQANNLSCPFLSLCHPSVPFLLLAFVALVALGTFVALVSVALSVPATLEGICIPRCSFSLEVHHTKLLV